MVISFRITDAPTMPLGNLVISPICRAAAEMQTQRADLWTQVGKERVGLKERVPLKHIYYHM